MSDGFFKSLTIPCFTLPSFVAAVGNKLPQWPRLALATGLNAVVKLGCCRTTVWNCSKDVHS